MKTRKSFTLSESVAVWIRDRSDSEGRSESNFLDRILTNIMKGTKNGTSRKKRGNRTA